MKKILISVCVGILIFIASLFVDGMIVDWVVSLFPPSVAEWSGLIRLGAWCVVLFFTLGISFALAFIAGSITLLVTNIEED